MSEEGHDADPAADAMEAITRRAPDEEGWFVDPSDRHEEPVQQRAVRLR